MINFNGVYQIKDWIHETSYDFEFPQFIFSLFVHQRKQLAKMFIYVGIFDFIFHCHIFPGDNDAVDVLETIKVKWVKWDFQTVVEILPAKKEILYGQGLSQEWECRWRKVVKMSYMHVHCCLSGQLFPGALSRFIRK